MILLREEPETIRKNILTMTTDPAMVRRNDPGNPDVCPVYKLREIYSEKEIKLWVNEGCHYEESPDLVKGIVAEGFEKARNVAKATLEEARTAMGLSYR